MIPGLTILERRGDLTLVDSDEYGLTVHHTANLQDATRWDDLSVGFWDHIQSAHHSGNLWDAEGCKMTLGSQNRSIIAGWYENPPVNCRD